MVKNFKQKVKLKKILIISPHFPPSNLAAVHRTRLFSKHLSTFGWDPVILTVHEDFYEETLDWNLHEMLDKGLNIKKVKAFKVTKPRLIGDIGIRAFIQLYTKAKYLIKKEKFDFVYIPIPSFYVALIGRMLNFSTGIKYGIDYIDPWVHNFPGSERKFSRAWFSTKIAKMLEPIAVKKASLITGVAEGYYKGVIDRNPELKAGCTFGAMPYGGEEEDHFFVEKLKNVSPLFKSNPNKIKLVYAGAMLPRAYEPLELILETISNNSSLFCNLEIYFIGSGKRANDKDSHNIKHMAEKYGVWEKNIFEFPMRIPYLDVLVNLNNADGIFILGSTEPHYTPSKVFQGILSGKPIFAILHKDSTALKVIEETGAGICIPIDPDNINAVTSTFLTSYHNFLHYIKNFDKKNVNMSKFEQYSAKKVTERLSELLEESLKKK